MELYFQEYGPSTAPTIVFLHGGGVGGWMWQPQVDQLKDQYHCLVPDLPEHGGSLSIQPLAIPDAAQRVADLIRSRAHGGTAHVVGLSLGAQVGVSLLSQAPEAVETAVISSALLRPLPLNWLYSPGMLRASYRYGVTPFQKSDYYARLNMKYSAGLPDQYFPQFREAFRSYTEAAFVHQMTANMSFRKPAGLERAQAPVLVIVGKKEYAAMQRSACDLVAALPNARGMTVSHTGRWSLAEEHNWSMKAPDLFAAAVRSWVSGQPLPAELEPLGCPR